MSAVDSRGRTIWIADAHRDGGKRFVVRADEKLTLFVELEAAIRLEASRPAPKWSAIPKAAPRQQKQPHFTISRHGSPRGGVDSVYSLFNGGESRRWTVGSPSREGIELFH